MINKIFNQIEIMPEDYEIINCPNCYEKHKRLNQNHFILCGHTTRKELYLLCITCGKIFKCNINNDQQDNNNEQEGCNHSWQDAKIDCKYCNPVQNKDKVKMGCGNMVWNDWIKREESCGTLLGFGTPNHYLLCEKCQQAEVNEQ